MKKNNFKVWLAVTVLTLSSVLAYTPAGSVSAKTAISKKKLTMKVSEKFTLKLKGAKGKVTWKSEKPKVAKVSKKGKVTALKKGKATITARNAGEKYKCSVTVKNNVQKELNTPVNTPAPAEPTPRTSYDVKAELSLYGECFSCRVTNIEEGYISIEKTDDTNWDYMFSFFNTKEKLSVDKRVTVFSNGTIIPLKEVTVDSDDLAGHYVEGDRMEYSDIKIGDIVDIIYIDSNLGDDSSKWSYGCRVINVKR